MNRKRSVSSAVGALVAAAVAGGVAYATIPGPDNVYSACMLKSLGTIRLIDKSLPPTNLMSHCTDKETEISWNQAGQPGPAGPQGVKGEPGAPGTNGTFGTNGTNGVSVTSESEPSGANCADGGVQLTAVNGVSYVCNGKDGAGGQDGAKGAEGQDGVSVTSSVEPAGSNCANGGSKFTAANGVTYACNGTNGEGVTSVCAIPGWFGVADGTIVVRRDDGLVACEAPKLTVELVGLNASQIKVWVDEGEIPDYSSPGNVCPTPGPSLNLSCSTFVTAGSMVRLTALGQVSNVLMGLTWTGCDVSTPGRTIAHCEVTMSSAARTVMVQFGS